MASKAGLIIGIAVVAILAYLWYKNGGMSPVTAPALVPGVTGSSTSGGTPVSATVTNPVTGQASTTWLAGNGNVEVPFSVQNWVQTGMGPNNQAQFMKMLPSMTADDMAGLNDIIINQWGKGAQQTPAQLAFWNAWYVKYGFPVNGTFNSFTGRPKVNQYGNKRRAR